MRRVQIPSSMLISDNYRELNRRLHARGNYGRYGDRWATAVQQLALKEQLEDILDYGCGQGALGKSLLQIAPTLRIREYDPAIPGKDQPPEPADLVTCTDVIEHIEPELLGNVLDDLQRLARKRVFAVVSTRLAAKVLEDGRNAHLIVQPEAAWRPVLESRFAVLDWHSRVDEFVVVLGPLANK
jgi:16S rRNA A1518/A1519 N6-dimethyltransferase RsmA/KsgA/DIM1 with predicted DNA glycosylase/AP lyase activity